MTISDTKCLGLMSTLHSLNALRVCMEFCVIHYHVSFFFPEPSGFLSHHDVSDNLMSFFFVLSGFVAMHSTRAVDFSEPGAKRAYIVKRFSKNYPVYLAWIVLDLPGAVVSHWKIANSCWLFWVSLAAQPGLLHSWLGCQHIGLSNGVGWYLCTLFWLWLAFPFLQAHRLPGWPSVAVLYCVSLLVWLAMHPFHTYYTRAVPLLRLPEFLMGCATALTLDRPVNGWLVVLGVCAFLAYCAFTFVQPDVWPSEQLHGQCQLWIRRQQPDINPTIFLSKFSLVWCVLIQRLAADETGGTEWLRWDAFRSLSRFSLHAYLGHYTLACALATASKAAGVFQFWSFPSMLLACYALAYVSSELPNYASLCLSRWREKQTLCI